MASSTTYLSPPARRARLRVLLQESRLGVYLLGFGAMGLGTALGVLPTPLEPALVLWVAAGALSAVGLRALYQRGWDERVPVPLVALWLGFDIVGISAGVVLTGGVTSPWFLWYLTALSAATFVGGGRAALGVAGLTLVAYLGALSSSGAFNSAPGAFQRALVQLLLLDCAALFLLRATARLRDKQQLIEGLREGERLKLAELVALTQDLDQGTRALAEANVQIREADRMKSQFLANMSHELRTPLNSIIGFSEILLDRLQTGLEPKYVRFLRNIHGSGQHLLTIINDILDLSKVEAGRMELHPEEFPVAPVIEGVLTVMQGMAVKRHVHFDVQADRDLPPIECDAAKFKQVLYNLLSNAVKFSHEGGQVRVRSLTLPSEDSPLHVPSLRLSVEDDGIGIAAENQHAVFQEFVQIDAEGTREFGGTGLGLSLVQKFTELMGGRIGLESTAGVGSKFHVTLPLRAVLSPSEPPPAAPTVRPGRRSQVLVVEDDELAYAALAESLGAAGYAPVQARNGQAALAMARTLRPLAITLDIGLPDMDGWEVLRQLKQDASCQNVPVVIVSMTDNRELGLSLGVLDYFVKPVDLGRLVARLKELAPPDLSGRFARLLVIDDDPGVHALLGEELERQGFLSEHAHSGGEGIELAVRDCPDAIVLDLLMPGLNGFEVAAALRQRRETAHVPIIVLTAVEPDARQQLALHDMVQGLIHKDPHAATRLVAAIRQLEARQLREGPAHV